MQHIIPSRDQLVACAIWNAAESDRAALAARDCSFPQSERDYFSRRAKRLSAQCSDLFARADDLEWGA